MAKNILCTLGFHHLEPLKGTIVQHAYDVDAREQECVFTAVCVRKCGMTPVTRYAKAYNVQLKLEARAVTA